VQRSSTTLAGGVFDHLVALDDEGVLEAHFAAGRSRKYFGGGVSMKSSRSMNSSRLKGILRVPAARVLRDC
jgi:predicted transcriptional regulator